MLFDLFPSIFEAVRATGLETLLVSIDEIVTAFFGGDWGYGATGTILGDDTAARELVNQADALGKLVGADELGRAIGSAREVA